MVNQPQKKPGPPTPLRPAQQAAAPDMGDFGMEDAGDDNPYQVFHTEKIEPPEIKTYGRRPGAGLQLPFDKLVAVHQWFLLPPFAVDKEARRKEKQRISSYVYKKRADGSKFKLIEIDERFANEIKRPELKGRFGVWRFA